MRLEYMTFNPDNYKFVEFKKSSKPEKKYMAILKNTKTNRTKTVHFGSSKHLQFADITGLGLWSHKDHKDEKRKKSFHSRMAKWKDKKFSPAYFSSKFLW